MQWHIQEASNDCEHFALRFGAGTGKDTLEIEDHLK